MLFCHCPVILSDVNLTFIIFYREEEEEIDCSTVNRKAEKECTSDFLNIGLNHPFQCK